MFKVDKLICLSPQLIYNQEAFKLIKLKAVQNTQSLKRITT